MTNIVTFWMVFLIQNTQNRYAKATSLKLDELIRSQAGARNLMLNLETMSEQDLKQLEQEFQRLRDRVGHTGKVIQPGQPPSTSASKP